MSSNGKQPPANWVGKKLKRKEDPRLIQGISHYTDDFKMTGMLYCVLVRSPHAHAKVLGIKTDAARALAGGVAGYTAAGTSANGVGPFALQKACLKMAKNPGPPAHPGRLVGGA